MPTSTVKEIVNAAVMELGLQQKPITTAVQSLDQDIVQMVALLSVVADEVLLEEPYDAILGDGVWVVTNALQPLKLPANDDDRILFDSRLAINGLKFRFLKAKGLEFAEEMRDFTVRINKLASKANGKRVLDLYAQEGRSV